jgi:RimJ/RimL family protein N-acetyltransferase
MIILETERLVLRNWTDSDKDLFYEINSDPKVMEYFPFRRDRGEADLFLSTMKNLVRDTGYGFYCMEIKATGEPAGFCGLVQTKLVPVLPLDIIEIGWRLATRHWGQGYVTEAGKALLRYGFEEKQLDEIVSFAVRDNRRSIAVMERIGLGHDASRDFDHPRVPESMPHLRPHVLYTISRSEWLAQQAAT